MVADINFAFGCPFKTGNHTQRRCFAAAGRPEERNKFAVLYGKVKIVDGRNIAEPFKNMLYTYFRQFIPLLLNTNITLSKLV